MCNCNASLQWFFVSCAWFVGARGKTGGTRDTNFQARVGDARRHGITRLLSFFSERSCTIVLPVGVVYSRGPHAVLLRNIINGVGMSASYKKH